MYKFIFALSLLTCTFAFVACEDTKAIEEEAKEKAYYDEVMSGHDVVMPQTAKIGRLARQMKKYLKENPDLAPELKGRIDNNIKAMMVAEDGMFGWMESVIELPELRQTKTHEEIMAHLKQEDAEMDKIAKATEESLAAGKKLWEELQPQ